MSNLMSSFKQFQVPWSEACKDRFFPKMSKTKLNESCSHCTLIDLYLLKMPMLIMVPFYFNIAIEGQQREHRSLFIC